MDRPSRARLRMPTLLAAATLGATTGCPGRGGDDTTADDAADDATSGELPDCEIAAQSDCEAADGCMWSPQVDFCVIDCVLLEDQATCESADFCEWVGETCEHHAI